MAQQIKFHILKSILGLEYHLAINGVILNEKLLDDGSLTISTDMLASMFSMSELSEMLESKKRSEEYKKQTFVSNRELAEWINAQEGRRCQVVYPNQMVGEGRTYTEWNYPEEMADSNASAGFEIFVEKEGSSILEFLTRKVIGLN